MKLKYGLVVVLAVVLTVFLAGCSTNEEAQPEDLEDRQVPVEVAVVAKQDIANETVFSGKVFADKDVMIIPKTPGKVARVLVNTGQTVRQGQTLFTLDTGDIQKQYNQAKAGYEAAVANYEMTKAQVENAQKNLERTEKLYEQGAVSESQYEQAKLAASERPLDAARQSKNQAEVGLQQVADMLANATVTAPTAGVVADISIEAGEYATSAQPSMRVVAMNQVYVQLDVAEGVINSLEEGQAALVDVPAIELNKVASTIDRISWAPNAMTGLYPIRLYLQNEDLEIKPGMFAKVTLLTDVKDDVIAIPSEAVLTKEGKDIVYVVNEGKAVEKEVSLGLDTGYWVEITAGLQEGQQLITEGQNYVEDGSLLNVVRGEN